MALPLLLIGAVIVLSGLGYIYFTSDTAQTMLHGIFDILLTVIENIPNIISFIVTFAVYISNLFGFLLGNLHVVFIITQIFFIGLCLGIHDPFKMIKRYLELNIALVMFIIGLFKTFINIIINIASAIGQYVPLT